MSLEHQNPSKTSEKMGYFDRVDDRVTVSLHILYTANQETEGSQDRLTWSCWELASVVVDKLSMIDALNPGGTPHMKGVGMLVGNFELNP